MEYKLLVMCLGLFISASPLYATETADVDKISMQVMDEGSSEVIDKTRVLTLPLKRSVAAAQQRENLDLPKIEMKTKHEDSVVDTAQETTININERVKTDKVTADVNKQTVEDPDDKTNTQQ